MTFWPFVYKETLHVLRDKRMLLVVFAIPVVQMLLFGFAISTELNNVNVAVAFERYDEDVRQATERLEANPYVTFIGQTTPCDVYAVLRRGEADAVAFFRNGKQVQVITDASNPNVAQAAVGYIQAIIADGTPRMSWLETRFLYNPQLKSSYNFVPGIMGLLFLLICALMTAVSIVREKEQGTMELLLVSPVHPLQIIISKMMPFFLLSCVNLAVILAIARWLLGVPMTAGVFPVILFSLIYIVLALGFGLLVSTIAENQVTAMLICGMVMIFPVIMLSGMIFPIDNIPVVLKEISCIVPARWYIDAMRKLMIEGLGLQLVLDDLLILIVMTIVILFVAVRKFKNRL